MELVRFPYRWMLRTTWKNLNHAWWDLRQGVENVVRWIPVIWFDRDWDADYLLEVMEWKLLRMAECFEKYGTGVNSGRKAKQVLVCAALCRRLLDDRYRDRPHYFKARCRFRTGDAQLRGDERYLGLVLGKHLKTWWD